MCVKLGTILLLYFLYNILPDQGPVITGLRTRYHFGDHVQVNCTSGRSRPACQLAWYINGEPAPTMEISPSIHRIYEDMMESTTLLIDFKLTEKYFTKHDVKVKCLATLASLYWRSNEESAFLEKVKAHGTMLSNIQETKSRTNHVYTNYSQFISSSLINIVGALLAILCCTPKCL